MSMKSSSVSNRSDFTKNSRIEEKRRQLIKSIEKMPDQSQRNSSRVKKHHRKNAQDSNEKKAMKPMFGVSGSNSSIKHSYIDMRFNYQN
jgi:hypothetical protein